jgi:hypothetical protein
MIVEYREAAARYTVPVAQRLGVDASGRPLNDDGQPGPLTRGGEFFVIGSDAPRHVREAVEYAKQGAREEGGNNRGPWVDFFWGGRSGGAWCARFVSMCLILAGALREAISGARRLTDAIPRRVSLDDVQAGDIISWAIPRPGVPYGGHVGIVVWVTPTHAYTIEGNGARRDGAVGLYRYDRRARLVYGRDKHPVWRIVRPEVRCA